MLVDAIRAVFKRLALRRDLQNDALSAKDFTVFKPIYQAIARDAEQQGITPLDSLLFDAAGHLAPGIHSVDWSSFSQFGWNRRRRKLLAGLERQMRCLKAAGCQFVVIGGSFVTSKEKPGDFEGCFDAATTDTAVLMQLEPALVLGDVAELAARDGGALVAPVYLESVGASMLEFLQFDDRINKRKGVVLVHLH